MIRDMADTTAVALILGGLTLAGTALPWMARARRRDLASGDYNSPAFTPQEWELVCRAAQDRGVDPRQLIRDATLEEVAIWQASWQQTTS